jgi:23S rRNA pseudouridine2605 synthase
MPEERLQKLIARSGQCSRRDAEQLIRESRVTVNGQVAKLGDRADVERDHVKVDGKALRRAEVLRYLLLYKPRGVMTTCDDPEERTTVVDLVRPFVRERVFPVGRLDYHSEGLLLLTNDGELAERVSHPRRGLIREYLVKIRGDLDDTQLRRLLAGSVIEGRRVRPRAARRLSASRGGTNSWWCVEVTEGRTHEVRELFFRAGHHVQRLRRTAIGPLRDDRMGPGDLRPLTEEERLALTLDRPVRPPRSGSRSVRGRAVRRPRSGGAKSPAEKRTSAASKKTR